MQEEIWKDIPGYEGYYQASSLGRIKSLYQGKNTILKYSDVRGYKKLTLIKDTSKQYFRVHRLIGLTFIDNPLNKEHINHINGIRDDNRIENLEWCTPKENAIHRRDVLGYRHTQESKNKISIAQLKPIQCSVTLKIWYGNESCAKDLGIKTKSLNNMLNGYNKNKTTVKYI